MKNTLKILLVLLCTLILSCAKAQTIEKTNENLNNYTKTDINDLSLIYQGGSHRIDWTEDQFLPYVVHTFIDGRKEWLFDGFLFLEFKDGSGHAYASRCDKLNARHQEWSWLLDRLFEEGKSLHALDKCIESQIKILGNPEFKHQIVLGLPEPIPNQKDWGELNGKTLDFTNTNDRFEAGSWYIDELVKRFKKSNFKHITLAGFYWVAEDMITSKDLINNLSNYIHTKQYKFYWIPYFKARGFESWEQYGFDVAYLQPNHFFNHEIPDSRIDEACSLARQYNMAMEMEFDEKVLFDTPNTSYNRLVAYIDYFEKNGVFKNSSIAYYSGSKAIIEIANSKNNKDKQLMDRLAEYIISRRVTLKK